MKKISLDKTTTASFDIDPQKSFTPICPDELPVPCGDEIVPYLNSQANFAQYRLGSKDAHSHYAYWLATADSPQFTPIVADNMDMHWKAHCIPGTQGFELLDGLPAITAYDYFVWKGIELDMHPYGACYHDFAEKLSTGVVEFLSEHSVTTVIVGGLATDYCVFKTVTQLLAAKLTVIVHLAACRAIAKDSERQALATMKADGAILIDTLQQLHLQRC